MPKPLDQDKIANILGSTWRPLSPDEAVVLRRDLVSDHSRVLRLARDAILSLLLREEDGARWCEGCHVDLNLSDHRADCFGMVIVAEIDQIIASEK